MAMNTLLKSRALRTALVILMIALALELFVFNFRHWESLGYRREDLTKYDGTVVSLKKGENALKLNGLDRVVENVYLDCAVLDKNGDVLPWQQLTVTWYGRDDANSLAFKMGSRRILTTVERMRYARINLLGETKALRLEFTTKHDDAVSVLIRRIAVNAPVPLFFSIIRLAAVAVLMGLAALLRPGSAVYRPSFEARWKGRRAAVAATCVALCVVMCAFVYVEGTFTDSQEAMTQHHYLARAPVA